jgi:PhnB protein
MHVEPYLNFDGRCEEAVEFYKKAVGAEVQMMMRFSDSPEPVDPKMVPPANANKIMHASWKIGSSVIMGADCACQGKPDFKGISLSLNAATDADAQRIFNALADGGKVQQPLIKTFFASSFGLVADRFGVSWMIVVMTGPA